MPRVPPPPPELVVAEKLGETYFRQRRGAAHAWSQRWRWRAWLVGGGGCLLIGLVGWWGGARLAAPAQPTILAIADFDSGGWPQQVGGVVGVWLQHPEDPHQGCRLTLDRQHGRGGTGYALRVEYDVDSDQPAMAGVWVTLPDAQAARGYDAFEVAVRMDERQGATRTCLAELRTPHRRFRHQLEGITASWRRLTVPLGELRGEPLQEVVLLFEDHTVTQRVGTLYLDDLQLRRFRR